ncbi:MAG: chlorobactene lauroyltransferase [Blastocatellia bacterium]|jgi:1-acyl-sn-glycerol-3-phosphate acyltransferase|nr:chlorobactene lauroyltransferase [Blastocatellia bacterium]
MLPARKSKWFEWAFGVYNRNLLARRFEGLRVAGLEALIEREPRRPLVLYANHSSWWDGLVAFQLSRAGGLEQYAMMEERQVLEYPFHRRLGAFGVVRESARDGARAVEYAGRLLKGTNRALWIFPQGLTLPNDARPLRLYTGAARVIERACQADAAPVAMRYEFLDDYRPEAFARIGPPQRVNVEADFNARRLTDIFAERLTSALDELRADILSRSFDGYEEIVAPRRRRKAERRMAARRPLSETSKRQR